MRIERSAIINEHKFNYSWTDVSELNLELMFPET